MHPSQSFLTEDRTFMPRICACCWDRSGALSIRGIRGRELKVFGIEVKDRVMAAGEVGR